MQTIAQQRARFALERVQQAKHALDADKQKQFNARASELPAMIQMNGLGQAAAFYRMKGETHAHRQLYDLVSAWLCRHPGQPEWSTDEGVYRAEGDLLEGIAQRDMHTYRRAQAEALALMDWVKKFAKAYLP
jgi:CRISPR-associated protein Cmr5